MSERIEQLANLFRNAAAAAVAARGEATFDLPLNTED